MSALSRIRNIGIIAHIDAGKTTLTERMLFYTRKIHNMGEVHDGTATMDFLPEEQERGITIASACTSCTWDGYTINIIDTPGHVDFTIEVERCLRVLDGAIGVFCAVGGVEPQSETVWRQSEQFSVPKIAFINKLDRPGASFAAVLTALRQRLGITPLPLFVPLGEGDAFQGIIDLLHEETLVFDPDDQGQTVRRQPVRPEDAACVARQRQQSLETLADADEAFLEAYLGDAWTEEDFWAALRRATLRRRVTPVCCGSALRNTGVQPVLDTVCRCLPSPADSVPARGLDPHGQPHDILPDPQGPLSALAFKILMEEGRKLVFLRLYSGTIREGESCRNLTRNSDDRIHHLYRMHADRRERIASAGAGDIVTVVGLRSACTGDSYGDRAHSLLLERIDAYQPVITLALEPRNADEGKALDAALTRFTTEDPTLQVTLDEGSGHRMVSGMGELHLEVLLERIRREYGITPRAGNPLVVQRETILREADADARFDRELGKEAHYGSVSVHAAPRKRGTGNRILLGEGLSSDAGEAAVPRNLLEAARQGIADSLQSGSCTGYPVQDVAITITALDLHNGKATVPGTHIAAGAAVRQALEAGQPVALEPIMNVSILVPEPQLGNAVSLLNSSDGRVESISDRNGLKNLEGHAPLRRLFGFSTALRSATQGRAGLVVRFARFDTLS